jgi:drug/metabolite transporter (DMT)-like permease
MVSEAMNRELMLVGVGLLLTTIHSIDESIAFAAPSGPPWVAQAAIVVVLVALCAIHPRLGGWRLAPAALVSILGAFVVRTGWQAHVQPLLQRGFGPTDPTGVLFVLGGALLLAVGALLLARITTKARPAGLTQHLPTLWLAVARRNYNPSARASQRQTIPPQTAGERSATALFGRPNT